MNKTILTVCLYLGTMSALSSCSDDTNTMDDLGRSQIQCGELKPVTFSITQEGGSRAKAPAKGAGPARIKGDGSGATQLRYCFYDADTNEPLIYTGQNGAPEAVKTDDGFKLTVTLDPQKKYFPVFMASASFSETGVNTGKWVTTFNPTTYSEVFQNKVYLSAIYDYSADSNINDANYNNTEMFLYRDFTKVVDINKADCPTSFTLTRPYAEVVLLASEATINASTGDFNKYTYQINLCQTDGGTNAGSQIHSVLNLLTGAIDDDGTDKDYICWDEYMYNVGKAAPLESYGGTGDYKDYKVLYRGFVLCGNRERADNNLCFRSHGFGKGIPSLEAPLKFSELKANTRYLFITGGTGSNSSGTDLLGGTSKTLTLVIAPNINDGNSTEI